MDAKDPNTENKTFTISVKHSGDSVLTATLTASSTTRDLKTFIRNQLKIPPGEQTLIFNSSPLEDGSSLLQSGLTDGAIVNLLPAQNESFGQKWNSGESNISVGTYSNVPLENSILPGIQVEAAEETSNERAEEEGNFNEEIENFVSVLFGPS
eukprot:TRINITY_DN7723_c0_g1_i1.p2 TRINITY_DN7723_c0_g1~~TRINITY_DN7723_c0_g1_i1.p2  ORF type:complete len:153 (-),score=36.68 TRINITY_DN7723_c0_g1_i1:441-899(-)